MEAYSETEHREPWNMGKIVGQKAPLRLKDILNPSTEGVHHGSLLGDRT
ncbi:hypothetical protein MCEMSHM24_00135 [Comamonadaceae bacterium]